MGCSQTQQIDLNQGDEEAFDVANQEYKISQEAEVMCSRRQKEITEYALLLVQYGKLTAREAEEFDKLDHNDNLLLSPLVVHEFLGRHGYEGSLIQMLKDLQSKVQYQEEMFMGPQAFQKVLKLNSVNLD